MKIQSTEELEKIVEGKGFKEIKEFMEKTEGIFSLINPVPYSDVLRYEKMLEKYDKINLKGYPLLQEISDKNQLKGLDLIKLWSYMMSRQFNKGVEKTLKRYKELSVGRKHSNKRYGLALQNTAL
ncbi:MAG: hypothetical protein PHD81_03365 [Candidatus Nanoarchaeia archaeon]|nr:hypothetical protein [Candidatus Nanoarchaeia archaeon]MDD5588124.1 hypothetical protein [Candidatus Nanoarchaeia archaeon]